jgi:DNA gyrase/topoisomerase IV subunit A
MQELSIKQELIDVIENQIKANKPEITSKTLQRLLNNGTPREIAISKIATELVVHMHEMMKNKIDFDLAKYTNQLNDIR